MSQTHYEYLRGLAERIHPISAEHDVDGGDVDRLREIAAQMDPSTDDGDPIKEFCETLDNYLIETVKLSPEKHPRVFARRGELVNDLRCALDSVRWSTREVERRRLKKKIEELLR